MHPIKFEGMTHNFGAPPDWDEASNGKCHDLAVRVDAYEDGSRIFNSVWKMTWRERFKVFFGGKIEVGIYHGQPPVLLSVSDAKELQ